jgi:peptide-methionine (S)-S-oxide reductase
LRERLESPGAWLRDKVGGSLEGFFTRPYLLWFVAEDPVRNGKLPANIAEVARTIIAAAKRAGVASLPEQIDYALRLVCWSWIARECGVQIELVDTLLDADASLEGRDVYAGRYGTHADAAIYNKNFAAAERLVERGAEVTLTTAVCLGRWADVDRLMQTATEDDKQNAFVQAAMCGKGEALRRMLALGMPAKTSSRQNQSHGTALHHAVWSGSLEAVRVLVEAGADLTRRDGIYDGTPLGWAEYGKREEIAAYLRGCGAK